MVENAVIPNYHLMKEWIRELYFKTFSENKHMDLIAFLKDLHKFLKGYKFERKVAVLNEIYKIIQSDTPRVQMLQSITFFDKAPEYFKLGAGYLLDEAWHMEHAPYYKPTKALEPDEFAKKIVRARKGEKVSLKGMSWVQKQTIEGIKQQLKDEKKIQKLKTKRLDDIDVTLTDEDRENIYSKYDDFKKTLIELDCYK